MSNYSPPKVIIDLQEYNDLISKIQKSDLYERALHIMLHSACYRPDYNLGYMTVEHAAKTMRNHLIQTLISNGMSVEIPPGTAKLIINKENG